MPATSKAQRRFFGMLEHTPGMAQAKGIEMTKDQMHDFAATKEKGLPEHVKPVKAKKVRIKKDFTGAISGKVRY